VTHKIPWTEKTWNPIIGCSRISAGCANCYAEAMATRLAHMPKTAAYRDVVWLNGMGWSGACRMVPDALTKLPLRPKTPTRVFVCSMGDLFHECVSDAMLRRVWRAMRERPDYTWQLLTKRPHRIVLPDGVDFGLKLWVGTSAEDQATLDRRVPELAARVPRVPTNRNGGHVLRWLSLEPLLEEVDLTDHLERLDWVVVGGESGPKARPCNREWIARVVRQCRRAHVPVFVKQMGAAYVDTEGMVAGRHCDLSAAHDVGLFPRRLEHAKGADLEEWPQALRVQEWPKLGRAAA